MALMRTSLLTRTSLLESIFGTNGSHENLFTRTSLLESIFGTNGSRENLFTN
ncbi:hypothetical protein [Cedratvirus kamchatka]|uniref:Uncharacterized protein n=1 Tax=Cedratvirus kamchatka TaxID=2716914 RepID=A0A6G8MZF0_9VIRU|nr:hypothetical protein [Cedratvirus kamchatka]